MMHFLKKKKLYSLVQLPLESILLLPVAAIIKIKPRTTVCIKSNDFMIQAVVLG